MEKLNTYINYFFTRLLRSLLCLKPNKNKIKKTKKRIKFFLKINQKPLIVLIGRCLNM